eukprot:gene27481-34203_t
MYCKMQPCQKALKEFDDYIGTCTSKWADLKPFIRPTQPQVGYAWVQYKLHRRFSTAVDAQYEINKAPIPVVIGPGPRFYIVDGHHTFSALDFSGFNQTIVTLDVISDERNSHPDKFWHELFVRDLAYLAAHPSDNHNELPVPLTISQMPTNFSFNSTHRSLSDDPWRALVSFSRKIRSDQCIQSSGDHKYCGRCMFRGCQDGYKQRGDTVAFFEFRWSYFMNDATFYNPSIWDSEYDHMRFKSTYSLLPVSAIGAATIDDWFYTAQLPLHPVMCIPQV